VRSSEGGCRDALFALLSCLDAHACMAVLPRDIALLVAVKPRGVGASRSPQRLSTRPSRVPPMSDRLAPLQRLQVFDGGDSTPTSSAARRPSLHTAKAKVDLLSPAKAQRTSPVKAKRVDDATSSTAAYASKPIVSAPSTVVIPPNSIGLRVLPAFLTRDECATLIALSRSSGFEPSAVGASNQSGYVSKSRTSYSCALGSWRHPLIVAVRARIAAAVGASEAHIEGDGLQLLRYETGQKFSAHRDSYACNKNPRRASMLIYLNDMPADGGGETRFTQLDVQFTPTCGTALTWLNCSDRETVLESSEHQSLSVKRGVKYVVNEFIFFDVE
jgi:hypothetical protein